MKQINITIFLILLLCNTAILWGHSGRLDGRGGHNDTKNNSYHYHQERMTSEQLRQYQEEQKKQQEEDSSTPEVEFSNDDKEIDQ